MIINLIPVSYTHLWKQWMLSGVLVSAMVVSCGVSVSVQAEETTETEEAAETDLSLIHI